jgi:hypothetical protein
MPCVEFEPTIPASEQTKTVHALDCSATVTGNANNILIEIDNENAVITAPLLIFII